MERLYGLSNQEFADGRARDRHENRLFPEYEILSELLARRAEPADDRSDAANVGPARAGSAARMRSALRTIREAQKFAGPSIKRDSGSRAKSWRVASRIKAVGTR